MGISIQPKTNYSALFSSIGSSNSNLNFLSDYASIKNGSYGKLMKAYYTKDGDSNASLSKLDVNKNKLKTSTDVEDLTKVKGAAEDLKKKTDAMLELESDDKDAYLSKLKDFTASYNNLIDKADATENTAVLKKANSLVNLTESNKDLLSKAGLKIGDDLKLSIDEEAFKKADVGAVKNLFKGAGSYAYSVSSQATMIDYQANYESIKASTYTKTGSFNPAAKASGNMFDSIF